MLELIRSKHKEIVELCRLHHVKRLCVFGSAVRSDFDSLRSDVDLLVEFEPFGAANRFESYFRLHEALEGIFCKKVDLIEAGSIKNPYIQRAVERDQRTLYAA